MLYPFLNITSLIIVVLGGIRELRWNGKQTVELIEKSAWQKEEISVLKTNRPSSRVLPYIMPRCSIYYNIRV